MLAGEQRRSSNMHNTHMYMPAMPCTKSRVYILCGGIVVVLNTLTHTRSHMSTRPPVPPILPLGNRHASNLACGTTASGEYKPSVRTHTHMTSSSQPEEKLSGRGRGYTFGSYGFEFVYAVHRTPPRTPMTRNYIRVHARARAKSVEVDHRTCALVCTAHMAHWSACSSQPGPSL